MALERVTILYTGRVQGVGFRWTTTRALANLPVTGYVRNLPDGRVELVLEGATSDIAAAEDRVRTALGAHIATEERSPGPATGEFAGFGVRR